MKSYFDSKAQHTPESLRLISEVQKALGPLFTREVMTGYSPREIHYVMTDAMQELMLMAVLDIRREKYVCGCGGLCDPGLSCPMPKIEK